jgi:Coenzyme PQQ synthesis protein D (PqqD)
MQVEKASSTVFTPLADGTGVLLHLETLLYYSLNRTGAALWRLIEEKKLVPLEDLVDTTCEQFEVDHDEAQRTLKSFVEKLAELRMVRIS